MADRRANTILIVDDDADIREAVRDTLEQDGYATAEANDGGSALRYLAAHPPPSLVLLDWNMAPMNGADFMDAVARDPAVSNIPVILLTADGRLAEANSKTYGFVAFLKKPVRLELLFSTIDRFVKRVEP